MKNTSLTSNEQRALVRTFGDELAMAGFQYRKVDALVAAGWTLLMVREATDIAKSQQVPFGYVARLSHMGIALSIAGDLIETHREHPDLSVPALHRLWQRCMHAKLVTADDREFFDEFLEFAEDLFDEAAHRLQTEVTRSPSFVFSRLLEYVAQAAKGDLEAVRLELADDPENLLMRILTSERSHERGSESRIMRGNPFKVYRDDDEINLVDLADGESA